MVTPDPDAVKAGLLRVNRICGNPLTREDYQQVIAKLIGEQPDKSSIEDLMEAVRRRRLSYKLTGNYR